MQEPYKSLYNTLIAECREKSSEYKATFPIMMYLLTILHTMDNLTTIRDMDSPDALVCIEDNKFPHMAEMELLKCLIEDSVDILRDEKLVSFKTDKLLTLCGLLIEIGKRLPIYHAILGDKAAKVSLDDEELWSCKTLQGISHKLQSGSGGKKGQRPLVDHRTSLIEPFEAYIRKRFTDGYKKKPTVLYQYAIRLDQFKELRRATEKTPVQESEDFKPALIAERHLMDLVRNIAKEFNKE